MTRKQKDAPRDTITPKAETSKDFVFKKLAVFGDSGFALLASFSLLLIAVGISVWIDNNNNQNGSKMSKGIVDRHRHEVVSSTSTLSGFDIDDDFEERYKALGPIPAIDPPHVYSMENDSLETIQEAYKKDGVVAVRGLLSPELLERLDRESRTLIDAEEKAKRKPSRRHPNGPDGPRKAPQSSGKKMQFHTQKTSLVFLEPPFISVNNETGLPTIQNATAFLDVAVLSDVPKFASKLLLPELQEEESVRMLRDIFLAKDEEEFICGWHVDDFGFWPATASSPGLNAWIALDDMPVHGGGGFALAVGSHEAAWKDEAHHVTGATTFYPRDGFKSAADLFQNRTGKGTCNIQTTAPHLYRRMEDTKRIYELKKGDVIFHQRWLFHRTVAFERDYVAEHQDQNLLYRRYSVRFAPGSAIIPPGYGTELSVLWDENNGNRTADEVGPWYPHVWPSANLTELQSLEDIIHNKIPVAEERKLARRQEMQPFLKQAAKRQASTSQH